jgi:tetratricopeptide (TPR) repeat protein
MTPPQPQDAVALFNQGYQQYMTEDFVGAIASYDKVLQIKPDSYEAWYNRGLALYCLGEIEKAITSYDVTAHSKKSGLLRTR